DDAGSELARLLEEAPHPRRPDADIQLDELRPADADEWDARLARHGACQQRLARARGPNEEHAARDTRAELGKLGGRSQEIDDLLQLILGLLDAGDIGEPRARTVGDDG